MAIRKSAHMTGNHRHADMCRALPLRPPRNPRPCARPTRAMHSHFNNHSASHGITWDPKLQTHVEVRALQGGGSRCNAIQQLRNAFCRSLRKCNPPSTHRETRHAPAAGTRQVALAPRRVPCQQRLRWRRHDLAPPSSPCRKREIRLPFTKNEQSAFRAPRNLKPACRTHRAASKSKTHTDGMSAVDELA